jgi:hypothetical protein
MKKTNKQVLSRKIVLVYCKNHIKHTQCFHQIQVLLGVKPTCTNCCLLKDYTVVLQVRTVFEAVELETISPEVTGLILQNSLDEREKLISHLHTREKKLN